MIQFSEFKLKNGLRVIHQADFNTPLTVVCVLYYAGAKFDAKDKSGTAHLLEHLMFEGSQHIPNFDIPLQNAGGENNAFTNSDVACYYNILPAENIETAFWLESDRMLGLRLNQKKFKVQQKVVLEEFIETCTDEPFGDVWHHLRALAFPENHPYSWPVLGKSPQHVKAITLEDIESFYHTYYVPNNAILVVVGAISLSKTKSLTKKWFGEIARGEKIPKLKFPKGKRKKNVPKILESPVSVEMLYMAFKIYPHAHPQYLVPDIISDLLAGSKSALLVQKLVEEKSVFSNIDVFTTDEMGEGLLVIEAKLQATTTLVQAREAIWQQLSDFKVKGTSPEALAKVIRKNEADICFSDAQILHRSINLANYKISGNAQDINTEIARYRQISTADIVQVAKDIFVSENESTVAYQLEK